MARYKWSRSCWRVGLERRAGREFGLRVSASVQ